MRLSKTLKFWQPVGIRAMVEFEDSAVRGGINADDVGLGKTAETIGLLLFRSNKRREALAAGKAVARARPTLILLPANLIKQWHDEFMDFTDRFTVVIYYGAGKKGKFGQTIYHKGKLTQLSDYFNGDEANADIIVISAYATWSVRHGPKAQRKWQIDERRKSQALEGTPCTFKQAEAWVDANSRYDKPDRHWPEQMTGKFIRTILDEGQEIRHLSKEVGTTVTWIRALYRHVLTATPTLSSLSEITGIMAYLEPDCLHDSRYLEQLGFLASSLFGGDPLRAALEDFNPWRVLLDDPRHLMQFSRMALDTYVFNGKNISQT
jgi:hypothetical protein